MIRKLIRQMLAAQILSALTVSLCLLIDSIMIGRFLGVDAIAAYGLANPLLLVIGAVGTMLSAGVQVACSRSLGKGSREETDIGFSSAIGIAVLVSGAFLVLALLLREPLATLMGAGSDGALFEDTRDYIAGFSIGAPGSMGALILVPFLQMAGESGLLVAAVLTMTLADVGLDLLNVLVFQGGMFGMGLASSLSYYAALMVGGVYFFRKKCVFSFSFSRIRKDKIRELLVSGVPSVFTMASTVVLTFVLNRLLLGTGGSTAVAAYSVIATIGNSANCISTGVGGVSLTVAGILANEEDRTGLKDMLGCMTRWAWGLGLAMTLLLLALAPVFVSLFIPEAGPSRDMAILGTRLFALGLAPCCFINALKNIYQGIGRVRLTECLSVVEGAVLPSLTAWVLSAPFGVTGIWFFSVTAEMLTLLGLCLLIRKRNGSFRLDAEHFLLLPKTFGVPAEDLLEAPITSLGDVNRVSEEARQFCRAHGNSPLMSNRIALCVEEMGNNTVQYGFDGRNDRHLSVRLQHKEDRWILRFRDDCRSFDPVRYATEGAAKDGIGIRLVRGVADEVRYTYSMNLNNLMILLRDGQNESDTEKGSAT